MDNMVPNFSSTRMFQAICRIVFVWFDLNEPW